MGFNGVYSRKLKNLGHNVVMIYHGITGTTLIGVILIIEAIVKGGIRTFEAKTYGILCAGGFFDAITVNALTIAFMNDTSGFVSLLTYTIVFYGFLADIIIFDEDILVLEVVGAVVVLIATVAVSAIKLCQVYRKAKRTG